MIYRQLLEDELYHSYINIAKAQECWQTIGDCLTILGLNVETRKGNLLIHDYDKIESLLNSIQARAEIYKLI